jgi:enoyl-CoA hydratase/carnithine racemase
MASNLRDEKLLFYRTRDRVTEVFFNQPEKRNPLDLKTRELFAHLLKDLKKEKSDVVVFSGTGGSFSAGGDLDFLESTSKKSKPAIQKTMVDFYNSFLKLRELPQVTIAKITGPAVGAGLSLALACDLRTALASAKVGFNFVRIGLNAGMGSWPLARAVLGEARARHHLLLGRIVQASDFFAQGGASVIAWDLPELEKRTEELVNELKRCSPIALREMKKEMAVADNLQVYLRAEARGQAECFKSKDILEGIRSVRERREPRF